MTLYKAKNKRKHLLYRVCLLYLAGIKSTKRSYLVPLYHSQEMNTALLYSFLFLENVC